MAKKDSVQQRLGRVRPPRVQLTYDVEVGDAIEQKEIPFVVGVLVSIVSPAYLAPLFFTPLGQVWLGVGIIMLSAGIFVMNRMGMTRLARLAEPLAREEPAEEKDIAPLTAWSPEQYESPRLSPDGTRVAVSLWRPGGQRDIRTRFTHAATAAAIRRRLQELGLL